MSNKGVISNINLNNNSSYSIASTATAICSTAANTKVKVASIVNSESGSLTDFTLIDGLTINVFFENTNTADSPTLNINESGQRFIYKFNTSNTNITWKAGSVLTLTYFSDQEKEGWWINGEYDVAELYKITVTYSDNKYSSDKNYEDILAAYNSGDKFIYLASGDDIYPLVSKGQVSFNFENATDTGLSKFVIRWDEPQQQDEDYTTGVYYKFVKFTSTAADTLNSGDKLVINRTTSIGNYSYSENLTSPITFGSSSSQYLANNGTWQNIPNHANDISYRPYDDNDWPYGDPQDVQSALDDLAARKTGTADVQVNGTSILSSGIANIITSSSHPYNASTNPLATTGDIPIFLITVEEDNYGDFTYDKTFAQLQQAYDSGLKLYVYYEKEDVHHNITKYYYPLIERQDNYTFIFGSFKNSTLYLTEDSHTVYLVGFRLNDDATVEVLNTPLPSITFGSDSTKYLNNTGSWSTIQSGVSDVKIDNSTIVSSGIANITTSTSHPYSSNNPLATIGDISAAGGGTVTSITAGTGLTGGTITSSGTIALDTSGVTAGTYQGLTVDTYGRVTSATNKTYSASEISYQPVEQGLQVENVCEALDDLYVHKADLDKVGYIKINNTNYLINGYQKTTVSGISGISISYGTGLDEIFLPDGIGFNTGVNNILSTVSQTYAPLASPALTGIPTAPTATSSTNTTQIATTEFVQTIKGEISSTIPTKVSDLTNDSGFITSNSISFKSGDTYTISTGRLILPGFIGTRSSSTGKATIYLNLELPKSYGNLSINISSMSGYIRGIVGYLTGSAALDFPALAISDPTNYTFNVTKMPPNRLQIEINCAVADVTSQTPVVFCSQNSGTRLAISFS